MPRAKKVTTPSKVPDHALKYRKVLISVATDLIKESGLSLKEVSERTKVGVSNLNNLMYGSKSASIDALLSIATGLGNDVTLTVKPVKPVLPPAGEVHVSYAK